MNRACNSDILFKMLDNNFRVPSPNDDFHFHQLAQSEV
jgi:hypothetical protein